MTNTKLPKNWKPCTQNPKIAQDANKNYLTLALYKNVKMRQKKKGKIANNWKPSINYTSMENLFDIESANYICKWPKSMLTFLSRNFNIFVKLYKPNYPFNHV